MFLIILTLSDIKNTSISSLNNSYLYVGCYAKNTIKAKILDVNYKQVVRLGVRKI
jgi:hypothetical protein